jgi:hypothetical protein
VLLTNDRLMMDLAYQKRPFPLAPGAGEDGINPGRVPQASDTADHLDNSAIDVRPVGRFPFARTGATRLTTPGKSGCSRQ